MSLRFPLDMSSPAAVCPSRRWPGRLWTWPAHPRSRPAWWLRTPHCGADRHPRPILSYALRRALAGLASRTPGEPWHLPTAGRSRSWSRSRGLPSTSWACRRPTCKPGSAMRTRSSAVLTFSGTLTGRVGEADGAVKYADPARAMAQLERDTRLRAAGFEVVHFTWREITRTPDQVAATIRTAFRRGVAR